MAPTQKMKELLLPVIALNVANGVAFCDLLAISAIMPTVTLQFTTLGVIEWSTTSQLIGATIGQCVLGYLSDVWSRRDMLVFAILLLFFTSIATALVFRTDLPILFVLFRAFSGIAVGSISNFVNITQADIATGKQRLQLQGVQGASVAVGSILGMMVGAVSAQQGKVYQLYWVQSGLSLFALVLVGRFVKPHRNRPSKQELRGVMKTVDYAGILSGTIFIVCGLLLMTKFIQLSTPIKVSLGALAGFSLIAFVYVGVKRPFECRPILPFFLFRKQTICTIYIQNLLFGAAYYTFIYFLPLYLMVVRQKSAVRASAMMIGYFVCHGIWSAVSARLILWLKKRGHRSYSTILLQGFSVWAVAIIILSISASVAPRIPISVVVAMAALVGVGTGSCFQNTVLAIKEHVGEEYAVALGARNVLRYLGGAIGTAISGMIMRIVLHKQIPTNLDEWRVHTIDLKELRTLPMKDQQVVMNGFGKGIEWVLVNSAVFLVLCIALCALIQEAPQGKEDEEAALKKLSPPGSVSEESPVHPEKPCVA